MKVVEVFYSLQGEGRLAGVPSLFIRLAGCSLHCSWCDTRYAWDPEEGADLDTEMIVRQAGQWSSRFVVITGGEPMMTNDLQIRPELTGLTRRLKAEGYHITIETAGMVFIPDLACDLMSISPKLDHFEPSPFQSAAIDWLEALRQLITHYDYQLKFVIESSSDKVRVQCLLERLGGLDPLRIMLMPQAQTREELQIKSPMVAQMCLENGWVFCQRLHLHLWGNQRGR
jgi:7-carboxy-7-deazaguanine synthase